jgi:hypothetical protein
LATVAVLFVCSLAATVGAGLEPAGGEIAPLPPGVVVQRVDLLAPSDLFVLGQLPSSPTRRTPAPPSLLLAHTSDGGRSFEVLTAPPVPIEGAFQAGVVELHFVDDRVGYVTESIGYANVPELLYETDDGGHSWHPGEVPFHENIVGLKSDGGRVVLLLASCSRWVPCTDWHLGWRPAGSALPWSVEKLHAPAGLDVIGPSLDGSDLTGAGLSYGGRAGLVWGTSPRGVEVYSTSEFDKLSAPWVARGLSGGCALSSISLSVVWADCDGGRYVGALYRSDDSGHRFLAVLTSSHGSMSVVTTSSSTAVVAAGEHLEEVIVTVSGARSVKVKPLMTLPPHWFVLSLAAAGRSLAAVVALTSPDGQVAGESRLWLSDDGGIRWRAVR